LKVGLAAPLTAGYYPFIVAQELGYFEDEGLSIDYAISDEVPLQVLVENNTADLSTPGASEVIFGAAEGASYKVLFEPWTKASEGVVTIDPAIKSMEDLVGKKVGVATDEDNATLAAALNEVGLEADAVDTAVIGEGGPRVVDALQSGDVVAYVSTGNVFSILKSRGVELRDITPDTLAETASVSVIASPETIESQGDAVEGLLRAMAKGVWAGQAAPEAVTAMYKKVVPDDWRDPVVAKADIGITYEFYKPVDDQQIGQLFPERWENAMNRLLDAGEIEEPVDVDAFLDPQFIDAANDWDRDEVQQEAEEWLAQNG
jgi:NitT/TauT family transport system substrate-binding protein